MLVGNEFCMKSNHSLKISNGLWNDFSEGYGGKNAIDYFIKVKGYTLKSHAPSQRANGFMTLAGGVIIMFAKEILDIITGG